MSVIVVEDEITLAHLMGALDALSRAARRDDPTAYIEALEHARWAGASADQISDAYRWGRSGARGSFDVTGTPH